DAPAPRDRPRGRRRARQVRGADAAAVEDADHTAPRTLVRLPGHHADADVPPGVPAAESRREAARLGGRPEGHARPRAADRGQVMRVLVAAALAVVLALPAPGRAAVVDRIVVDGAIGPAVAAYVAAAIERA